MVDWGRVFGWHRRPVLVRGGRAGWAGPRGLSGFWHHWYKGGSCRNYCSSPYFGQQCCSTSQLRPAMLKALSKCSRQWCPASLSFLFGYKRQSSVIHFHSSPFWDLWNSILRGLSTNFIYKFKVSNLQITLSLKHGFSLRVNIETWNLMGEIYSRHKP